MVSARDLRSFVIPTSTQIIVSLGVSLVYIGLTFHDALTRIITGATNTQPAYFAESYQQQINSISQFGLTKSLTIGIFWAGVGIIGYFVIITVVNMLIALRNEVVIDSMFANAGTLASHFVEPAIRLALIVVFALALLFTLNALIPNLWLPLAGDLLLLGFTPLYAVQAIAAILGLALNAYGLGLLVLAIKNLDQLM